MGRAGLKLAAAAVLVLATSAASAHHSFAVFFDATKVEANAGIPSLVPRFYYEAKGAAAALAAAEAFSYGANAIIETDAAGLKPFAGMISRFRPSRILRTTLQSGFAGACAP